MPRPLQALIHLDALHHNLQRARECAPDARVWAVVKANAYGHGLQRVYEGLRGADGFALLDIAEAQRLRELDWRGPILLIEGVFDARDLEWCSRLGLWHVVHCDEQINWLAQHKTEWPHRVFLKMNTGMNRLGFTPQAFRNAWVRLSALPQVDEVSFITHFSDADSPKGIAAAGRGLPHATRPTSAASAACATARPRCATPTTRHRGDWIRPGVMLYGASPDYPEHDATHWGLQPAMTLHSKLIGTAVPAGGRHGGLRQHASPPSARCASAWWPAAMPTATRATPPPAPRCWSMACECR
jgi:alanine racemase